CTSLCVSRWTSFDDACAAGLNRLDNADDFICAVDIRRSRSSVLPLPTRRFENGAWVADREIVIPDAGAPSRVGDIYEETDSRMITKTDVWKRELLDISNRNPLVSMKAGAKAAALMISDPPSFEDSFLEGTQYTLMPRPQDWNGSKFYSEKPFETGYYIKNYSKACPDDIARGWIRTPLSDTDMQSSLKSVYRLYRRELEESGCNSLFVTVGVLRWFEDGGCKSPHYAPLILIPAELIKKQKNFILAKYDEDAVFNVTLAEKLRQEYDITITNIDPLPADENGIHVERIMQNVRRCIEGMEGWEVLDSTALGVFSFSQYAMWKDIDKNMERLCANPIVSAMVSGGVYHADEELGTGADPYGLCLTVAADGSQIRAVRAAGEGKSFVMHGPPGTGKSQTITNLISDSLYRGKTVLFVAEKRAALEVVQKRLDEIGIGNHCLELHSDKTEKSRVLDQLRKSLEPCKEYDVSELDSLLADLESMRSKLDSYVSELHMKRAWGFSAYECISRYEMHNTPGVRDLKISPDTAMSVKPEVISGLEDDILKACRAFEIAREMCDTGSLADIRTDTLAASLQFDIEELMDAAEEAADRAELLGKKLSGPAADNIASAAPLTGLLLSMDENVVSDENFACIPEKTEQAVSLWEKIMSSVSSDSFLNSDRETLLETAEQAENLKNILSGLPRILQDNMMEEAAKDIARICTDLSGIYADRKRIEARWKPSVYSFDRGFGILDKWKEAD
ncbi:MAG: DUF4011 domain-containing protein, partial [Candidatus Methanomethylophilaceae archaeon]|nr:DUF4011 domain-containing protein [Candidatus Methanomethylophilaceae archaeon]